WKPPVARSVSPFTASFFRGEYDGPPTRGSGPAGGEISGLSPAAGRLANRPAAADEARRLRRGPGDLAQGSREDRPVPWPDRRGDGRVAAPDSRQPAGAVAAPVRPTAARCGPGALH